MLELPDELGTIAGDTYFALRQLSSAVIDVAVEELLERSLRNKAMTGKAPAPAASLNRVVRLRPSD